MLSNRTVVAVIAVFVQLFIVQLRIGFAVDANGDGSEVANEPKAINYTCEDKSDHEVCDVYKQQARCNESDVTKDSITDALQKALWPYCLNTCGKCAEDEKYNCGGKTKDDKDSECAILAELGFCSLPEMTDIMALECPITCGLCNHPGPVGCQNKYTTAQCRELTSYCNSTDILGDNVRENCAFTCKKCDQTMTTAAALTTTTGLIL